MSVHILKLFNNDLNLLTKRFKNSAKVRLENSDIKHDTTDESLTELKLKVLNSCWELREIGISENPVEKSSEEVNLNHNDALRLLRQSNMTGNNPATIANYVYEITGSNDLFQNSPNGMNKIEFYGNLTQTMLTIKIVVRGSITENNVGDVKQGRDQIVNRIKQIININNTAIKQIKAELESFIDQTAEQIRIQKIRIKNTNDLL